MGDSISDLTIEDYFAAEAMRTLAQATPGILPEILATQSWALAAAMVAKRPKKAIFTLAPKDPVMGLYYLNAAEVALFVAGKKINAIKELRTRVEKATGQMLPLIEAKNAVETYGPLGHVHPDAIKQNPAFH
jgi:ribosomal protein L7/L12